MAKRKNYPDNRNVLTREALLNTELEIKKIFVPQLDGCVFIREMSALEAERYAAQIIGKDGKPNIAAASKMPVMLCAQQIVTEDGQRMFARNDIEQLRQGKGAALSFIAEEIRKLSGLDKEKQDIEVWLSENYPEVLAEWEANGITDAIEQAEADFFDSPTEDLPSD